MGLVILLVMGLLLITGCAKDPNDPTSDVYDENYNDHKSIDTNDSNEDDVAAPEGYNYKKQFELPDEGEEVAIMTTNYGVIKVRLFEAVAPKAVENFMTHSKNGYYDGLTFHRVMEDFMIQGGDPDGTGRGGESIYGKNFEDEFSKYILPYRGALCMANSGSNTNGSQFFIMQMSRVADGADVTLEQAGWPEEVIENTMQYGAAHWLFFEHTTFGQVYEGMDVVDLIAAVDTDMNDKPVEDVIVESIEIVKYSK